MLDNLACGLEDYLKEQDNDGTNILESIRKKIEPYRLFNLDFEVKKSKVI